MYNSYEDIREEIEYGPFWHDENGVPRYCRFRPEHVANIYADEACLAKIRCQSCGRIFDVAFSRSASKKMMNYFHSIGCAVVANRPIQEISEAKSVDCLAEFTLAKNVKSRTLHYGDSPNVECCPADPTMNSEMIRVVEFWQRDESMEWGRVPVLEIVFEELQE